MPDYPAPTQDAGQPAAPSKNVKITRRESQQYLSNILTILTTSKALTKFRMRVGTGLGRTRTPSTVYLSQEQASRASSGEKKIWIPSVLGYSPRRNDFGGSPAEQPVGHVVSQATQLEEHCQTLQAQLTTANDRIRELEQQNRTLMWRADKLQTSLNEKDTTLEYQKSDQVIMSAVNDLFGDIKTWANRACASSELITLNHIGLDGNFVGLALRVAPGLQDISHIPEYIGERKRRKMFLRGLVGLIILEAMIRNVPVPGVPANSTARDQWLRSDVRDSVSVLESNLLYSGK